MNMHRFNRSVFLVIVLILLSGCHVETHPDDFILKIDFTTSHHEYRGWAAATEMLLSYHDIYYSQEDLFDYRFHYSDYGTPSIYDVSWLLWDLAGLDSYVTGNLSFGEIKYQLHRGNPVLLQYGGYFSGNFLVLHGYDHLGHVYIHEPGYGTRIVHYDDLYYWFFHNVGQYWESSLILEN